MLETLLLVSELGQEGRSGCGIRLSPTRGGPDVTRRGAEGVRGYVLPDSRICDTIRDPLKISSRGVMLRRPEEPLVASQPRRITSGLPQEEATLTNLQSVAGSGQLHADSYLVSIG